MEEKEVLYTLTTLTKYLNDTYTKKTGKPFEINDVQGYAKRGVLPEYIVKEDGSLIKVIKDNSIPGVNLYKLV